MVKNLEMPPILCRVTQPYSLKVKDQYIQPHLENAKYGCSLPMVHPNDWVSAARLFACFEGLRDGNGFFLLLVFNTALLEELKANSPGYFSRGEHFAKATVDSIRCIYKYAWRPSTKDLAHKWHTDVVPKRVGVFDLSELL